MRLKSLLRSLSHRNFRLFFAGQSISLIGTWMQQIAMSWLVFQLTGSSFQLGLVLFCGQIPALFLSPVAGVLVDRWNRHRVLILTQAAAMVQAFALGLLDISGTVAVWQIIPLSLFLGVVNAFDMTARQAFLSQMVTHRGDLGNAIALNSSIMNGARLVGPAIAGFVLAQTNAGVCFLINGFSYLTVLASLFAMRLAPLTPKTHHTKIRDALREGLHYVFGSVPIRTILLMVGVSSLIGSTYNVLLPEFSVNYLHGDARTLGTLSGAGGLGALFGAVFLASRSSVVGLGKWMGISMGLMGLGLFGFVFAHQLATAFCMMALIGFGMMVQMATSNTVMQTIVDDDKRGRVMSFFTMAFLGMAPLGSLLTGALAARFGVLTTFAFSGIICMIGAIVFRLKLPSLRRHIRPIYVRLNLLPPLAAGIENASELRLATKE